MLDVENQQKMSELSKKKSDLTRDLAVYKETFNTYAELLPLLNGTFYRFFFFPPDKLILTVFVIWLDSEQPNKHEYLLFVMFSYLCK